MSVLRGKSTANSSACLPSYPIALGLKQAESSVHYEQEASDPTVGLYIPAMVWTRLYDFTPDAVCLAGASTKYDNKEVIRTWD